MKLNRPGWRIIHDDIANISCLDLEDYFGIKKGELDLLSGGAPCQAFSYAGKRLGLEDDDCACFLVEAIAKRSQNMKWTTRVDGKNVQHRLIRRVSMDQFYAIVTVPEDTVIQELRKVAELYHDQPEDLAMAIAVYMLGFHSYLGFCQQEKALFTGESEAMLKHIYEYAKRFI